MGTILAANAAVILITMLALWGLSIVRRDVSLVDIAWGPAFALVAWTTFLLAGEPRHWSGWLLPLLTTLWGTRLGLYLLWRKWGEGEDPRYGAMREARGNAFWWKSLYVVFLLQGAVLWVISLPLQVGIPQPTGGGSSWQVAGLAVWLVGFLFESLGDWQLAHFKSDPANRGKVMDRGLWRYTRHPNYFGDFCVWWGLGLIAVGRGAAVWTLVGPLVMSWLLLRISGVTLLEKSLQTSKPGYAEYVRRTSPFVPWPPKPALGNASVRP